MFEFTTFGKVDLGSGSRDDEIRAQCAARRPQFDAIAALLRCLDSRALVEMEVGKSRAAVIRRLRKSLPQFENRAHETPAPSVVEIAEMTKKAAKRQPPVGLDDLDLRAPAQQVHLFGACFQSHCRIIER